MNTYQIDSAVRIENAFTLSDETTAIDPDTVILYVRRPDDVVVAYTGGDITRTGPGGYRRDIVVDQAGPWVYKWRGEGNCDITSADAYFQVARSAVLP